ncbi:MAG TPA: hypothetical protein ENJ95_13960 [Bacteroidetes bacterium]|nr:hypothetical protein [Bacteroidota bacterium]
MEENQLTPDEELRIENKLKALDLELTYGAETHIASDAPPEIVSQFFDNVKKYEEQYANAAKVPVHEFIGRPEIKRIGILNEQDIEPEIERLIKLLEKKCVLIDRPEHLSPEHYYRFLSEEFMQHPMTDHSAPGMMHFFNYHEFHHDGPEFIEQHVSEFLLDILNLDHEFMGIWMSEHCRDDHNKISKEEAIRRINTFRAMHKELKPIAFKAERAETHNGTMYLFFGIAWEGLNAGSSETERHEGLGVSQLGWEDGEWLVQGLSMPGFSF